MFAIAAVLFAYIATLLVRTGLSFGPRVPSGCVSRGYPHLCVFVLTGAGNLLAHQGAEAVPPLGP